MIIAKSSKDVYPRIENANIETKKAALDKWSF